MLLHRVKHPVSQIFYTSSSHQHRFVRRYLQLKWTKFPLPSATTTEVSLCGLFFTRCPAFPIVQVSGRITSMHKWGNSAHTMVERWISVYCDARLFFSIGSTIWQFASAMWSHLLNLWHTNLFSPFQWHFPSFCLLRCQLWGMRVAIRLGGDTPVWFGSLYSCGR